MDQLDFGKAVTDFWTMQAKALVAVQEQAGRVLMDGMQAMAAGAMAADPTSGHAELTQAGTAMAEMWSAATSMSATLAKAPAPGGDPMLAAVFARITDPRQWLAGTGEMDDVLGRMAEGPRFADLWEIERRYARVMRAWVAVRRRSLEHNAVTLEAWVQAGKRFTEELARRGPNDAEPDAKAALALWTDIANRQLLDSQRSDAFLSTQRELIRATTELRLAQQDLVEHVGKQYGFPTRTELDDVHRTVTAMRREMRQIKRAQRTVPVAETPAPVAPPLSVAPEPVAVTPAPRRAARQKGMR